MSTQYQIDERVVGGVEFIIKHLQGTLFPRKIMTKKIGYQVEVSDMDSLLKYYGESDYLDCRINAYPISTGYKGINMTPPGFIMIDLDLRDFRNEKVKLDNALKATLDKIKEVIHGRPTVLWTGNGYHIYQPIKGFVLEELDVFAKFVDPSIEDHNLTTKFMRFAEGFFTNKKSDPQHGPSVNSCLLRIPRTYNSKCKLNDSGSEGEVKTMQEWDGNLQAINYLLRDFRKYLINERIKIIQERNKKYALSDRRHNTQVNAIRLKIDWIENLLQMPVSDHRKYVIRRILAPYLVNVKRFSDSEAFDVLSEWLEICKPLRKPDFDTKYLVKYNIRSARKVGFFPISFDKLKVNNKDLYCILTHNR